MNGGFQEGVNWRAGLGASSTHTFTLEGVEEVAAHLPVVAGGARRVVHACHVVGRVLGTQEMNTNQS